jgi:hypothetical protein
LKLENGTIVNAMFASQVKSILLLHENDDIKPAEFHLKSETFQFTSCLKIGTEELKVGVSGKQFSIISNSCTTGHKLQGCTCGSLLVNEWDYRNNWAYVVLSRVRKMEGLYLRVLLTEDLSKYAMPEAMKEMLKEFREKISLCEVEDEEYDDMIKSCTAPTPTSSPESNKGHRPVVSP